MLQNILFLDVITVQNSSKIEKKKNPPTLEILNKSCHTEKPRKTPSIHRQLDKFPGDTRFTPSPVTVPGSPFSISARRAISGRPFVERERERSREGIGINPATNHFRGHRSEFLAGAYISPVTAY